MMLNKMTVFQSYLKLPLLLFLTGSLLSVCCRQLLCCYRQPLYAWFHQGSPAPSGSTVCSPWYHKEQRRILVCKLHILCTKTSQYNKSYILSTFEEKKWDLCISNRSFNKLSNDTTFVKIEVLQKMWISFYFLYIFHTIE